jgi:uncharacterized protein (TIGR03435 family)
MPTVIPNPMLLLALAVIPLAAHASAAQPPPMAADAHPTYEVATIKPSRPDADRLVQMQGARLVTADTSVVDLMMFAYGVHPSQVIGGPDWLRTQKFDLLVQPNLPGRPSSAQMKVILQKLLTDRFNLVFHHAQMKLPVYRIVPAKSGPKLTPTSDESKTFNTAAIGFPDGSMTINDATLPEFANLLLRYVALDRPVVDHTGIPGKYDYKLTWTPDFSQFNGKSPWPSTTDANAPPSLYTAIQEQLGLKLEAAKEPTDVLLIDHATQPSDN